MPDDLQPEPGQGDAGTPGIFDSYLESVPEAGRETVAAYLKDAEKNVNSRLSEAAELQKQWAPYNDVRESIAAYDPESLSQLIAWHQQVTSSDDAWKEWLSDVAAEAGLTVQQEQALEEAQETGTLTREEVQQLVKEMAGEQVAPVQAQLGALETERDANVELTAINGQFEAIRTELGRDLTDEEKTAILNLGAPLSVNAKGEELPAGDASWVKGGYDQLKALYSTGSRLFVEDKVNQPKPALTAGGNAAAKAATTFADAGSQLRERLRQSAAA